MRGFVGYLGISSSLEVHVGSVKSPQKGAIFENASDAV
jgi:hypothetical protein